MRVVQNDFVLDVLFELSFFRKCADIYNFFSIDKCLSMHGNCSSYMKIQLNNISAENNAL